MEIVTSFWEREIRRECWPSVSELDRMLEGYLRWMKTNGGFCEVPGIVNHL